MSEEEQASILLEEYNPDWPFMFLREKEILEGLIGEYLEGSIEHIGSTSVVDLVAKPVIDTMFGVSSLDSSRAAIEILKKSGYQYSAYKGDVLHWFCKPSFAYRTHHLHLVPFESALWFERTRFRDCLRTMPDVATEYTELKKELARKYENDREAYTDQKWPFIESVINRRVPFKKLTFISKRSLNVPPRTLFCL